MELVCNEQPTSHEIELQYNRIVHQCWQPLCYLAAGIVQDEEKAKDLVQDSFMKLWPLRMNFSSVGAMIAFLEKTCRHKCLDELRKQKRVREREARFNYIYQQEDDPAQATALSQHRLVMLQALAIQISRLNETDKHIITEHYYHGIRVATIALNLNVSESTVYWRLKKIRTNLKQYLRAVFYT
jgi:RNA polymerase sigma-70 factor (ECF subfamily)